MLYVREFTGPIVSLRITSLNVRAHSLFSRFQENEFAGKRNDVYLKRNNTSPYGVRPVSPLNKCYYLIDTDAEVSFLLVFSPNKIFTRQLKLAAANSPRIKPGKRVLSQHQKREWNNAFRIFLWHVRSLYRDGATK